MASSRVEVAATRPILLLASNGLITRGGCSNKVQRLAVNRPRADRFVFLVPYVRDEIFRRKFIFIRHFGMDT